MTRRLRYQIDAAELRQAQAEHRRNPPPGCICILCLGDEEWTRRLTARRDAHRQEIGEPPF